MVQRIQLKSFGAGRRLFMLSMIAILATLFSCDRMKRKGNEVVEQTHKKISVTKGKIADKKDQFLDEAFPIYDHDQPDTENNKKRFRKHLKVDLTDDVKNIYAYGDFLGSDYKVLISFTCNTSTITKIVKSNNMSLEKDLDEGLEFGENFPWWHKSKIAEINPYKEGEDTKYWRYLWFDQSKNTAYYLEFSI